MGENNSKNTTPRKSINVFVLLFGVLTTAALATYLLPAGQYQRQLVNGRNIVVPNSYASVESSPVGIFSIFSSISKSSFFISSINLTDKSIAFFSFVS